MGGVHTNRRNNRIVWFALTEHVNLQAQRLTMNAAAAGAAHGFGKAAAANLREKDDSWNPAIGGFLSGAIVGLRCEVHAFKPGIHILNVAELALCQ